MSAKKMWVGFFQTEVGGNSFRDADETMKYDKELVLAAGARGLEFSNKAAPIWAEKDFAVKMVKK